MIQIMRGEMIIDFSLKKNKNEFVRRNPRHPEPLPRPEQKRNERRPEEEDEDETNGRDGRSGWMMNQWKITEKQRGTECLIVKRWPVCMLWEIQTRQRYRRLLTSSVRSLHRRLFLADCAICGRVVRLVESENSMKTGHSVQLLSIFFFFTRNYLDADAHWPAGWRHWTVYTEENK